MNERVFHQVKRHARILHRPVLRWAGMLRPLVVCLAVVIGGLQVLLAQNTPRAVSLIISNGTVVTMDGSRRVLAPGSVAIDGTDIVAVDRPEVIRRGAAW
jgi:hypothetical protein